MQGSWYPWGLLLAPLEFLGWRRLVRRAVLMWVRGPEAAVFPGPFVPLRLRAASLGLCPEAVAQTGHRVLANLFLGGLCALRGAASV